MKQYKKLLCVFLAMMLTFSLWGCAADATGGFWNKAIEYAMTEILGMNADEVQYWLNPAAFVVFFEDENQAESYVPLSVINAYETQYPDCSGTWYRDQLAGEELTIYNGYLYAMEHSFRGFSLYVADNEKEFWHVRDMLALDSPFLEQNVNRDGEYTTIWDADDAGERIYFHVDQFEEENWKRKMKALEEGKKIVAEIPADCETQEEKMLYLYHYVCDKITYTEGYSQNYLYDAVCLGETLCDGYSNMLNLLFNLIGVEACEVMGNDVQLPDDATQEEIDENVGHTWVVAKLGENYYHFDPTYEDMEKTIQAERTIYFGVSDAMAPTKFIDYDAVRPACPDSSRDFGFTQLTMEDITSDDEIKALAELTDQRAKQQQYTTYVVVTTTIDEADIDTMLDSYIEKVRKIESVSVVYIDVARYTLLRVDTEPW